MATAKQHAHDWVRELYSHGATEWTYCGLRQDAGTKRLMFADDLGTADCLRCRRHTATIPAGVIREYRYL
jgi:hypothetical protein